MKNKLLMLFTAALISVLITIPAFAKENEYKFSAINLIISVQEDFNVLTRSVSESNPALEILGTNAVTMQNSFIQNNIYLNAFPDDLSYEILVTCVPLANKENAGFDTLEASALQEYMERLNAEFAAAENTELLFMDLYENDTTKYIHTGTHSVTEVSQREVSVYSERYYTVMNGFNYYFTLQTNDMEIDSALSAILTDMVNGAQYTTVKSSLSESGLFNEMIETFVGFALTVLILGMVLFMITRKPKRKH